MVPSSYVLLEALPLLPNGKLDRSALPPPSSDTNDGSGTEFVPPRTTTEEILARITADLLGRSRVGVHDNFLEIGVDSILGIQMVARARQAGLALLPTQLFRHPTIAELAAASQGNAQPRDACATPAPVVAPFELTPEGIDREALQRAFADDGGIEDVYPLTPVQEGMLFHTLADPEAGHYVEQFLCRVRGGLDLETLQESWQRLVARHPALRSTLHWTDFDRPYQVVHRRTGALVDYQDWRGLTPSQQEERLTAYVDSDRRRGFVPSQPPLSRLALLRLGEDVHQLIWSIHHVVIDGWCLSVLLHEILDINEALRRRAEPVLNPSRPFRDYVAWLDNQDQGRAEGYWRQALSGIRAATPLGLDGLVPEAREGRSGAVAERQTRLSTDASAALQALARSRRLTLSTLIQGAWALLLSRYSGREDVLFGVTVAGRPPELAGVESMVGMFINTLPLRVAVTEDSFLVPWLLRLQADIVELRSFEAIPLSRIQAWSEVPPGMPLFESIVIVQNLPFVAALQERANRLGIESAQYLERTHYPIAVTALPGPELRLKIGCDARRFDPGLIERTLGHLRTLLEAMAADPERALVDLSSMQDSEQEQLIGRWNRPPGEPPLDEASLDRLTEQELDALIDQLT
jgi:aryl carrier-like protein